MESRRRCSDRTPLARVHGLISLAIGCRVFALDVRRQRHVTDVIDGLIHGRAGVGPEPNRAASMKVTLQHFSVEHVVAPSKDHVCPGLQFLPWMYQCIPPPLRWPLIVEI